MDRYSELLPDQRALHCKRWAPKPEDTVDFRTFPDGTVTLESSNKIKLQAFGRPRMSWDPPVGKWEKLRIVKGVVTWTRICMGAVPSGSSQVSHSTVDVFCIATRNCGTPQHQTQ